MPNFKTPFEIQVPPRFFEFLGKTGPNSLVGTTEDDNQVAVAASSPQSLVFLASKDPTFDQNVGVYGKSSGNGVLGETNSNIASGVFGHNTSTGTGVGGSCDNGSGVVGLTVDGVAVLGQSRGTGLAGRFVGNVEVTGHLEHGGDLHCAGNISVQKDIFLANADCAEDFDISLTTPVEAGTVMVLGSEGVLEPSQKAYDKRVAGVISGAGDYKPGIVLDKQRSGKNRMPVALLGKVYCKVDAQYSPVEIGDLLTTSPTWGYAMKANDPINAFGSVIGKALMPLQEGRGLIPILVTLQ